MTSPISHVIKRRDTLKKNRSVLKLKKNRFQSCISFKTISVCEVNQVLPSYYLQPKFKLKKKNIKINKIDFKKNIEFTTI